MPVYCEQPVEEEGLAISDNLKEIRRKTRDNIVNVAHEYNESVLQHFRNLGTEPFVINAYDQLIDSTANDRSVNLDRIIPDEINKTGGLPKVLQIFVGAKVMLRSNINVERGLVNGAIGHITWPYFRRGQVHKRDIPSVKVNFGRDGIHLIEPKSIQFPAKYRKDTIERRMLPIVLLRTSTVHKMQGSTVDFAVIYLRSSVFAEGQAYVALSRVRSLNGLQIEELDCAKFTSKKPCNTAALQEMIRMRNINHSFLDSWMGKADCARCIGETYYIK